MKAWGPPVAAAAFSLALSLSTVGGNVHWQDSGFNLTVIHDFAVHQPPGFVVFEVLCKTWTILLGFVDFTLAVHLFSTVCAAGAAAAVTLAVRDFLGSREFPAKGRSPGDPPSDAGWIAGATGGLAASGYTFWFSGIYSKVYAFYYLVLALLLWRMVRASESGSRRDFTVVAVLLGLAWQAHPSASAAGLAFLAWVGMHRRTVGWGGIAWRTAVAAAVALVPVFFLPLLVSDHSPMAFGEPRTAGDLFDYVTAARYLTSGAAFEGGASRWPTAARLFWEEFLLVGGALLVVGVIRSWRANRRLLTWIALWSAPYILLATVFTLEVQQDHWYVGAWMPFYLLIGLGLVELRERIARRPRMVVGGIAGLGIVWALLANYADLNLRNYDLADRFGRLHLEPLPPDAIFISTSEDTSATMHYLQQVRSVRKDVLIVRRGQLERGVSGAPSWYDLRLQRREPRLAVPDYASVRRRFSGAEKPPLVTAAFINANALGARPLFVEEPPPASLLDPRITLVPAGPVWKAARRGEEQLDSWPTDLLPESVRSEFRRPRGQVTETGPQEVVHRPEPYERRLFVALLRGRLHLAEWKLRHGGFAEARDLYASILKADPETASFPEVVNPLGEAYLELGRRAPTVEEARVHYRAGLEVPNLDPRLHAELRRRLSAP
jgi:hypothetical protein